MSVDKIALTLPADDAFQRVAHLVLGGLASRHDLTVETLEELTLALDTVLERYGDAIDQVTVQMGIADGVITMDVGPFGEDEFRSEIESESDDLDVHRILSAVCDGVSRVRTSSVSTIGQRRPRAMCRASIAL